MTSKFNIVGCLFYDDKQDDHMIDRFTVVDMSLKDQFNQNDVNDEGDTTDQTSVQDCVPDVFCGDYENLSSVDLNPSPESVDENRISQVFGGEKEKNSEAANEKVKRVKFVFFEEAENSIHDTSYDSDYEEGDSVEFTEDRLKRKTARHTRRNEIMIDSLLDREGNKKFYSNFQEFMQKRHIAPKDKDNTLDKALAHLFKNEDSLLSYESKKDEEFFLDRLISFKADDYLPLKIPLDWLKATCDGYPSKAQERLKAHSYLVKYLQSAVGNFDFGGSTDDLSKKFLIQDGLDRVSKEISEQNLHAKYKKLIDIETDEKRQAKIIANPSEAHNVAQSVLKWNRSKEAKAKEDEFLKVYEDCMRMEP